MWVQVQETANQVGRVSVSSKSDVSYKEMAGHCEALLLGKQQKMSELMSSHKKQEYLMITNSESHNEDLQDITPDSHIDVGSRKVLSGYNSKLCTLVLFHIFDAMNSSYIIFLYNILQYITTLKCVNQYEFIIYVSKRSSSLRFDSLGL